MVAPLKERGLLEVQSLRSRAARLLGLRRVSRDDYNYIDKRLEEVEARIIEMKEKGVTEEGDF